MRITERDRLFLGGAQCPTIRIRVRARLGLGLGSRLDRVSKRY